MPATTSKPGRSRPFSPVSLRFMRETAGDCGRASFPTPSHDILHASCLLEASSPSLRQRCHHRPCSLFSRACRRGWGGTRDALGRGPGRLRPPPPRLAWGRGERCQVITLSPGLYSLLELTPFRREAHPVQCFLRHLPRLRIRHIYGISSCCHG